MSNQVIASNYLILDQAAKMSGLFTANAKLGLFTNAIDPDNATAYAGFVQPTFGGYVPLFVNGKSKGVKLVAQGVAFAQFGPFRFDNFTGPSTFVVGWFLFDSFLNVYASQLWPGGSLIVTTGHIEFSLSIEVRGLNLACP